MAEERQPDEVLRELSNAMLKELSNEMLLCQLRWIAKDWLSDERYKPIRAEILRRMSIQAEARAQAFKEAAEIVRAERGEWPRSVIVPDACDNILCEIERVAEAQKEKPWNGTTTQTDTGQASQHQKSEP